MSSLFDSLRQATQDQAGAGATVGQVGGFAGLVAAAAVLVDKVLGWQRGSRQDGLAAERAAQDQFARWAETLLAAAMKNQETTSSTLQEIEKHLANQTEVLRGIHSELRSGPPRRGGPRAPGAPSGSVA